ncbi:hypothetical protein HOP54_00025 [Halomonas daqingensis]|uniref:hypothetical protein n=1 Tax=Billgrantia desiderata TaxID=52021 RepID=UPI001F23C659|nr:hypothetical protein [Halomonas desiderata]MCE8027076.1 hypothetical protein [Halomonas desiderata]
MSALWIRFFNVSIRGATLGSKFLLIFFLAYYLEPSQVGLYGLFVAAVSYSIYIVGLEFYIYSTRELIGKERDVWGGLLKSHCFLVLLLYLLALPLLYIFLSSGVIPKELLYWFFPILAFEHLAQEFNRLLIAASRQVVASVVLFLRSGAWCVFLVFSMYFYPAVRELEFVFIFWSVGVISAAVVSSIVVYRMRLGGWAEKVNWKWVKAGVLVSIPFLAASLSVRGVFTLDRFFLEHYADLNILGAYVFFIGIANALVSFLDAAVFVFIYPALIKNIKDGKHDLFANNMKKLLLQTVFFSVVFFAISVLVIDYIIDLIGRESYAENKYLFYLVLASVALFVLGFVPQYGLYAQGFDRPIILSSVFALFVFVLFSIFGQNVLSYWAVPVGAILGFFASLLWKVASYFRLTPKTAKGEK